MDKNLDYGIYSNMDVMLGFELETAAIHQRKVLHSRMFKLSLPKSDLRYGIIGSEMLKSGQFEKSILPLKKATIIRPYQSTGHMNLAKALLKLEKDDEALSSIKKALSLNPREDNLHEFFIQTLEKKHRLDDLESFSNEIVSMIANPKFVSNFYFLSAAVLVRCEKFSQALLAYKKAMMENGPSMTYDQHYLYGFALYHEGRFEEALVQFEKVKKLNPNLKHAWNSIAYMNYCLGRVHKAREELEKIIENGLEISLTYSIFLLVLLHLDEDEGVINQYKDRLEPYIASDAPILLKSINGQLKITQKILQRDNIDERTREFNTKKLNGINSVLSLVKKFSQN